VKLDVPWLELRNAHCTLIKYTRPAFSGLSWQVEVLELLKTLSYASKDLRV